MFAPTEVVAAVQLAPLSNDTYTISPEATLADKVPLMVCAAVLVMKSVLLLPVSAEKLFVAMVVVGAVLSTVTAKEDEATEVLLAVSVALTVRL